jgi:hypothetical protein
VCVIMLGVFRLWAQVLFRKYCKNLVAKLEEYLVQYNGLQLNRILATEYLHSSCFLSMQFRPVVLKKILVYNFT